MKSEDVVRYFREVCGEYFPDATTENKRFLLTVDDNGTEIQVPIFVRRTEPAQYPQIRFSSFRAIPETYSTFAYTYSPGIPPYEDPNLKYKRARVDTVIHRAQLQVDIYTQDKLQVYRIRDALKQRIHKFAEAEVGNFTEWEWEQDVSPNDIYYNLNYNTNIPITRAFEDGVPLVKSDDLSVAGTWNLTDKGLFVNPYNDITQVNFWEITNGGYVFSDGVPIMGKGFMAIATIRSRPMDDTDPLINRWSFVYRIDYREDITMDVGRTFKELSINGENNE